MIRIEAGGQSRQIWWEDSAVDPTYVASGTTEQSVPQFVEPNRVQQPFADQYGRQQIWPTDGVAIPRMKSQPKWGKARNYERLNPASGRNQESQPQIDTDRHRWHPDHPQHFSVHRCPSVAVFFELE